MHFFDALSTSQMAAALRIVREGLSNHFKCGGISVVFSEDGLPDAGWVRLVKEIVGGYGYLDPKICLLFDINLLRT